MDHSLRERKKSATRRAIEDAAWDLFSERGYAETSVDEIAERAGVAPRTFFRYFPTKEAVLYGEADEALAALADEFRSRPADEPLGVSLVAAIEQITSRFEKDRDKMIRRFEMQKAAGLDDIGEVVRQRFAKLMADLVREREAGKPDAELRARVLAGALMATNAVSMEYWLEHGAEGNPSDCFQECLGLLRSVFGSPA
jgi:AcrR family transcriptional regulator